MDDGSVGQCATNHHNAYKTTENLPESALSLTSSDWLPQVTPVSICLRHGGEGAIAHARSIACCSEVSRRDRLGAALTDVTD